MTAATCPKCGKPIRPGTKFCGSCGASLIPASSTACPHCGMAVRQGAKFCSHCGKTIEPVVAPPSTEATSTAGPQASADIVSDDAPPPPAPSAQAIPAASPQFSSIPPQAPPRRRYKYLPWLMVIVLLVCLVTVMVGVWFYNPFGVLGRATSTATITATSTASQIPPETSTPLPTTTWTAVPPTATEALLPTETFTAEVSTPTSTMLPTPGDVIFEDEFDSVLAANWQVWGQPRPLIERGFGDNYLSLKSTDPAGAGVTSKTAFFLQPGVEMTISAQLQPGYSNYNLIFDWDPNQFPRGPGNNEPSVLQMEVSADQVVIEAALTNERCVGSIRGIDAHEYLLKVLGENSINLYVDGNTDPLCVLTDIGMEASIVGRITLRSMGLVSRVVVTSP